MNVHGWRDKVSQFVKFQHFSIWRGKPSLGPTACGPTPSSGGAPPQRPQEPATLVKRLNPPTRLLVPRTDHGPFKLSPAHLGRPGPAGEYRQVPQAGELPAGSLGGGSRASWSASAYRRLPKGSGGASEATMVSPPQSAVLATAPSAAEPRSATTTTRPTRTTAWVPGDPAVGLAGSSHDAELAMSNRGALRQVE
jgi:hypothetical protein